MRQLGGLEVLRGVLNFRRRGGGEDPWLCGPGFRRVCIDRFVSESNVGPGIGAVKSSEELVRLGPVTEPLQRATSCVGVRPTRRLPQSYACGPDGGRIRKRRGSHQPHVRHRLRAVPISAAVEGIGNFNICASKPQQSPAYELANSSIG